MQLYAYDPLGHLIFSYHAKRQQNYCCLECGSIVRLREGHIRKPHFYHLTKTSCRQSEKSLTHLQLQIYLKQNLPENEASLEHRFPDIRRIADVAWHPQKIIFEIQCSPMTKEEMEARVESYKSVGYQVVWVLHDRQFNKWRLSAMESGLLEIPHYYTNMDEKGKGLIYEQWRHIDKGIRLHTLPPLSVDLTKPYRKNKLGFEGDIGSLPESHPYLQKIKAKEKEIARNKRKMAFARCLAFFKDGFQSAYKSFLRGYCED